MEDKRFYSHAAPTRLERREQRKHFCGFWILVVISPTFMFFPVFLYNLVCQLIKFLMFVKLLIKVVVSENKYIHGCLIII